MTRKREFEWDDHLAQVLLTKPAEVVQEACQVLEKHGCSMKKELKSELYYKPNGDVVEQSSSKVGKLQLVCHHPL